MTMTPRPKLVTLMVDSPDSKRVAVSLHTSEAGALGALAEVHDPDGEFAREFGEDWVQGMCDSGYIIAIDEHESPTTAEDARVKIGDVALSGDYWALSEQLWHALASLAPTDHELAAAAQRVWEGLFPSVTAYWSEGLGEDPHEDDVADWAAQAASVGALEIGSDEWDNGWFPSGLTVLDRNGKILDRLSDTEVPALSAGEFMEELRALSGAHGESGSFQPHWSYRLRRPAACAERGGEL